MTRRAAIEQLAHGLELALTGVRELLNESDPEEWIDQEHSPLGRRRHCELARDGELVGARKLGGHWLARRREIDAYIERTGTLATAPTEDSEEAEVAAVMAFRAPQRKRKGQ